MNKENSDKDRQTDTCVSHNTQHTTHNTTNLRLLLKHIIIQKSTVFGGKNE